MITLSEHLKPVPPTSRRYQTRNAVALTLGMSRDGRPYLTVSRAAWEELGRPRHIRILLSRSRIAIEPVDADAAHARSLPKSTLRLAVPEIGETFSLRDAEKFVMSAEVERGQLVADLPGAFYTRYQYKTRNAKEKAT